MKMDCKEKCICLINIIFDFLGFEIIIYMMACFLISFQGTMINVLFITLNVYILTIFFERFKQNCGRKISYMILGIGLILLFCIVYYVGYLEISNKFIKFSDYL